MKITHFDVLQGPFVDSDQASRRVSKIVQNYVKMHLKSPQNEHEKMRRPLLQWSKTHAVAWPAKTHQNAFILVVPGVALFTPWMQKSLKIVQNSPQNDHKKYDARFCNGQKRTPAKMHQNALFFVVPGVALLTPWMQKSFKIVENQRWGHVRCLRSGPPRGGPIRSVYST